MKWKWWLGAATGVGVFFALSSLFARKAAAAALPPSGLTVSPNGARFIGQFEGFGPGLYNDPAGHCTIGFGHLIHRKACDGSEPLEFRQGITELQALNLLANDLQSVADIVRGLVRVPLTQAQFDALVSFTYNVGEGNLAASTLLRLLNSNDYASVPEQFNRFVYASGRKLAGLVKRRAAEAKLFATGDYGDLNQPFDIVR